VSRGGDASADPFKPRARVNQVSPSLSEPIAVGHGPAAAARGFRTAAAFALVVCFAAAVLIAFHDHFWLPGADGAYAHVAERLLAGEVLNRDVQDIHAGYVNFINAASMALFGSKLVALRYPLAFLTLVQVCLIFFLLRSKGLVPAVAGATGMAALSFVQFLNPSANWYALFLTISLIAVLAWCPRRSAWRLPALGFLLMTLFLFRQLTGVLIGIGIVTYLLGEGLGSASEHRHRVFARALLCLMGLGLGAYLTAKATFVAVVLFGLGPLTVIAWVAVHTRHGNRETAAMLVKLAGGAAAALAPLVIYHLANGSLAAWIDDSVMVALSLTQLAFFEAAGFGKILTATGLMVVLRAEAVAVANGVYWAVLILLAFAVGYGTLRALWSQRPALDTRPHVLPIMALFHAVVAVHYETSVYLMYTVALSLAGLLWLGAASPSYLRHSLAGLAVALSVMGLTFHAGQPTNRSWRGLEMTAREPMVAVPGLERSGLQIPPADAALYVELIDLIRRETPVDRAILALPVNPELYFLSGRRNPTRFFNTAFGVRSEDELRSLFETLRRDPPALVIFRPNDPYHTDYADRIIAFVRARYEPLAPRGGFEIYRIRPGAAGAATSG